MLKYIPLARIWYEDGGSSRRSGWRYTLKEHPYIPAHYAKELSDADVDVLTRGGAVRLDVSELSPHYWAVGDRIYSTTDLELTPADVVALANEAENKRRIRLSKAHALNDMAKQLDSAPRRTKIPTDVKVQVWQRDGGSCVECGSNQSLEFDHIIPLAIGGSNTFRNIQLLCEDCNRRKGSSLG